MNKKEKSIAKITPPNIKGIFLRKRLFNILGKKLGSPSVWVSSPSGSGKTTLIGTYLNEHKFSTIWYFLITILGDFSRRILAWRLLKKETSAKRRMFKLRMKSKSIT